MSQSGMGVEIEEGDQSRVGLRGRARVEASSGACTRIGKGDRNLEGSGGGLHGTGGGEGSGIARSRDAGEQWSTERSWRP